MEYFTFPSSTSGYGWANMSPRFFSKRIKDSIKRIKELKKELKFDAVAFRGSSGCALGFPLVVSLEIPVIYVRKPEEEAHGQPVEYISNVPIRKYLIIDDFMSTGSTVKAIISKIESIGTGDVDEIKPQCVGVFFYSRWESSGSSQITLDSNQVLDIFYLKD